MTPSREQMIDYLYGELKGEALVEFEAALRDSEPSRRELAELQATLRAARAELARDAESPPPARVRDAVLKAAQLQLAAAKNDVAPQRAAAQAPAPARLQPLAAFARWLRSFWILPSIVAATAAALLVFRQHDHELTPDGPTPGSSTEVVQSESPAPSGMPEPPAASDDNAADLGVAAEGSSSGAPQGTAPPRPARKSSTARSTSGERFAAPPEGWQQSPTADATARTRSESTKATTGAARSATHDEQAPNAAERRESATANREGSAQDSARPGTAARAPAAVRGAEPPTAAPSSNPRAFEASPESSALGTARPSTAPRAPVAPSSAPAAVRGTEPTPAAPSSAPAAEPTPAAASGTASARRAELSSAPAAPLTAARLEQRAREHAAAERWTQAAADYRELLRRFPQDPRRKLWAEQLELALRAATRN